MSRMTRRVRRLLWIANGRLGRSVAAPELPPLTVLITYFNPARARHADAQIRNVLRCCFVDRVIVLSHNPDLRADTLVRVRDPRLVLVNAGKRLGCGHRWVVALAEDPEYLLVIDDDILLRTSQIPRLFSLLVARPDVPHGMSGVRRHEDGFLAFVDRRSTEVDYLCEVYALTRQHLTRYWELRALVTDPSVAERVDSAMDFILVSRSGVGRAQVHDVGHILRCETFRTPGVAVHKESDFQRAIQEVSLALDACGAVVKPLRRPPSSPSAAGKPPTHTSPPR